MEAVNECQKEEEKKVLKRLRIGDQLNPPCSRFKGRMSLGKGKFAERVREREPSVLLNQPHVSICSRYTSSD